MTPDAYVQPKKSLFLDGVIRPLIFLTIVLSIILAWMSRSWGIVWDAAISHYVAWLISQGSVPYRDIFDVQFPGTYFIHLFVLKCIGSGDQHWRLFDLGCLVVINILIFLYCRPFGRLSGWVGVGLFTAFHLYNGPLYIGQRDYVLLVFILGAVGCIACYLEQGRGVLLPAIAGMMLGCAATVKPYSGLLWLLLLFVVFVHALRTGTAWLKSFLVYSMSATFAPALLIVWLWQNGGLPSFVDIFLNYLIPFYSGFVFQPLQENTLLIFLGIPVAEIVCIVIIATAVCFVTPVSRMRCLLLGVGMFYGFFHFYLQARCFYQIYPFVLFMFMSIASWVPILRSRVFVVVKLTLTLVLVHVCLLALYHTAICLIDPPAFHIAKFRCTQMLKDNLESRVRNKQTVQVMDFLSGMVHVLYDMRLRQPSRFIFDLHFFHDIDHPYIQSLRSEFLHALRENPPAFFILSSTSWPLNGYERLRAFPELAKWLQDFYRIDVENDCYRIYRYEGMQ